MYLASSRRQVLLVGRSPAGGDARLGQGRTDGHWVLGAAQAATQRQKAGTPSSTGSRRRIAW